MVEVREQVWESTRVDTSSDAVRLRAKHACTAPARWRL